MSSRVRLRLGVLLWFASWVPYGIILGLHSPWLELTWGIEIMLGVAGLALAGSVFAENVKAAGWRRAPGVAWRALLGRS